MKNNNMKFNFTIGADPEFSFVINNHRIHACEFLRRAKDKGAIKTLELKEGEIGWDGCSATAEIRPAFSNEPEKVAENIGVLFSKISEAANNMELSTLNFHAPVGGHIHLSLPKMDHYENDANKKIQEYQKGLMAFMLPIMASQHKVSEAVRNEQYGKIDDFRVDKRGDAYVMEVRGLNAEWTMTPKIARSTLAYIAVVYNEIVNHPENFKKHIKSIAIKNSDQARALQKIFLADYLSVIKASLGSTKKAIKSFEAYSAYKDEIDYILEPYEVFKDKQRAEFDIAVGWNLKVVEPLTKKNALDKGKLQEKLKHMDIDNLLQFYPAISNGDMNCNTFHEELVKRWIAYNWKPNNIYYLYGIKQGIPGYIVSDHEGNVYKDNELANSQRGVEAIKKLTADLYGKFIRNGDRYDWVKAQAMGKKIIFIGIPYEDREKVKLETMFRIFVEMERGSIKPIDTTSRPVEDSTGYVNIMNNQDNMVIDVSSQGHQLAYNRMQTIINNN